MLTTIDKIEDVGTTASNQIAPVKILIAEDSLVSRTILQSSLRKWGYSVSSVENGLEALSVLQSESPPPIAILDVDMPGMTGIEVCRTLRRVPRATPTYIIMLTADSNTASAVEGLEAGADDYVVKPFDPGELRARVKVGLRMAELQRSLANHIEVLQATFAQLESNSTTLSQLNGKLLSEIGDRTRAEEELRLQKILLESQSQASLDAVLVTSGDRKIISFNSRFTGLWDVPSDVAPGRDDQAIYKLIRDKVSDRPEFLKWIEYLYRNPDEKSHKQILLNDGRIVDGYSAPVKSVEGAHYGRVWYLRDITQRKQAEQALRESEERYRLLFESNPHPMWVYDLETLAFLAVNEAAINHYGYTREEFLAMTILDIRPTEELTVPARRAEETATWRHQKKDGSVIDVEITSHKLIFVGRPAELVLANDSTERKRLENQLRQAQKLESVGQLAAGIAHEINTPTQYVSDNTRFLDDAFKDLFKVYSKYRELFESCRKDAATSELLDEVEAVVKDADVEYLSEEIPKAIQQSLEGSQRISKIVRSMKDFAHPGTADKQAVDLNKAIDSTITVACNEWKYVAEMITDFDTSLPAVPCLLGELNQVVLNLIINASHAIADVVGDGSTGKGRITIATHRADDSAEIRVSDSGTGIPLAIRPRIFDPFFTTKEVGKGTGQGLAISHTVIVEKHGGSISFETEEGRGTTFIIRLPLNEPSQTTASGER